MSSLPNSATRQPTVVDATTGLLPSTESVRQALHQHLKKTASFIKFMDVLVLLSRWVAAMLLIWLAACAVDHWLWPLPTAGRWMFWMAGVAACGWWLIWQCLPLLFGRINPLYAAQRIEHLVPEFKNGLIAWLELERMPEQRVPRGVMSALAYRAARFIGGQDPSATVDTSPLIKMIGCVLMLTTSLAVYTMLSPKSVFATGQRIVMPWRSLAVPTRVQILEISPGAVELTQGKPLQVAVAVKGLRRDEPVIVRYSTLDGQLQNQRSQLSASSGGLRFQGNVVTSGTGVQHPLDYWIEAGDAQSGPFHVTISPLPAVVLQSIELQYPAYTRLPKRTISDEQVEAVEGTRATIIARANQTLQRGRLEINPTLDATGELVRADRFLDMTSSERQLQAVVPLLLDPERNNPTRIEYRIRGTNHRGDSNARPITHKISVLADVPPEVDLMGPDSRVLRVRRRAQVNLEVRASDPDFGLTKLTLHASRDGVSAPPIILMEDAEGVRGRQVKTYHVDLAKWQAAVGQRFELRARAMDNRHDPISGQPAAGVTESKLLTLLVVADDELADAGSQPPPAENEPPNGSQNNDNNSQNPQIPPGQTNQSDSGQRDPQKDNAVKDSGRKDDVSKGSGQQESNPQNTGQENGEQENPPSGESDQQDSSQQDGSKQGGNQQSGNQQSGNQQSGNQQSGNQQSGSQQSGSQQGGSQQGGSQQSGSQQSGSQQSGSQQSGSQQSGSQQSSGQPSSSSRGGQQSSESTARGKPSSDGEAIERVSEYLESQSGGQPSEKATQSSQGSESQGSKSEGSPSQGSESQASKSEGSPSQGSESQASKSEGSPSQGSESQASKSEGSPSQGSESQASKSEGSPSQGSEPQASKSEGSPSQGSESQASKSEGSPSQGSESQGSKSEGSPSQGSESQGSKSEGSPSQGSESQASKSEGSPSQGSESQASTSEGSPSQGSESQASKSEGSQSQGSESQASKSEGSPSQGSKSQASKSEGSPSQGSESQASKSEGSPSQGSEPQGSKSEGSPSQGSESQASKSEGSPSQGSESQASKSEGSPSQGSESQGSKSEGSPSQGSESQASKSEGSPSQGSESQASKSEGSPSQGSESQGSQSSSSSSSSVPNPNQPTGSGTGTRGGEGGATGTREAANREFAEKTTNMVLDYLNRQKEQPDPELLRELDWTPDDLQRFVDRWNQARDLADSDRPAERQQWQEMLERLNMIAPDQRVRQGSARNDNFQQMQDSGDRLRAPESLRKQFEAYRKAIEAARN